MFSPAVLNTARFGFSRASYFFTGYSPVDLPGWVAGQPIGAIVISGSTASNGASAITQAGTNVGSNNKAARNLFTLDDHVFWSHGKHQIEAGVWLQRIQSNDQLAQIPVWTGIVQHARVVSAGNGKDFHRGAFADGTGLAVASDCGIY